VADPPIITVTLNSAVDRLIEVPRFAIGAHQAGREVSRTPGGKGLNVSRVLAALDVPSVATGFVGSENRGSFDDALNDPHIRDEFFLLQGRTRENVTIADPTTGQETHVRDVGLTVPPQALSRLDKKLALLCRDEAIVVFSGSLPPGVGAGEFAGLVDDCIAAGARVAVDTSGPAIAAMSGKALWLVKPNAAELADLTGLALPGEADRLAAARRLAEDITLVLYSRGDRGACLFAPPTALSARVQLPPGRLVNTVGCGDALLAGFVAAIWRGLGPTEALVDAVTCASASACHPQTATFDPELMAELRDAVELTEIP
jgi:1-phosphofructokinase family hexose kinase